MALPLDISRLPREIQVPFEQLLKYLGPLREQIRFGTGTPEGAVTAPVGTLFLRTDSASTLYVKQTGTGNTGWVLK